MDDPSRARVVALVVLLAISGVFVAIALGGQDKGDAKNHSESPPGGLRLEASVGGVPAELTIYIDDQGANVLTTTHGQPQVAVECLDRDGQVAFETRQAWPFSGTDGGTNPPHAHVQLDRAVLDRIVRCRLKDTDPPLEGRKP
jgi:hypothetical protein